MRIHLAWGIIVCAGTLVAAQSTTPPKDNPSKPITLNGCIARDGKSTEHFTLTDDAGAAEYRLTGMNMRDYYGKRVEIVGGMPVQKKLVVSGGLKPSVNTAAQAGSISPVEAAQETVGGVAGPGDVQLPEFKVKSVRPVSGSCGG